MTRLRRSACRRGRILARAALVTVIAFIPVTARAQRLIDYTPNTRAAWTMDRWQPAMVLSHRFEFLSGGDEVLNLPLITLGTAVSQRFAVGLDFSSNSEVADSKRGGNEAQYWLAFRAPAIQHIGLSGMLGYNTAAESVDGAVTMRAGTGAFSWIAEGRAFSDAFGEGEAGFAGTTGAVFHATPYLSVAGDVGQAFTPDGFGTVWSGGFTLAIPGTRHQFSFIATNGGPATMQGASRKGVLGPESVRYGFTFIAPLGTGSQWARVFRHAEREEAAEPADSGTARVTIRDIMLHPDTITIRAGQSVEWINTDPLAHTVTADDKSWASGFINKSKRFSRRFAVAGTYPYHCEPHPQMKGVVIVTQ
jgi:plastocyanin